MSRILPVTHTEYVVTETSRFGVIEIAVVRDYLDAMQAVIDHARQFGGKLVPTGSDSWNLWQIGATPRINIVAYDVEGD